MEATERLDTKKNTLFRRKLSSVINFSLSLTRILLRTYYANGKCPEATRCVLYRQLVSTFRLPLRADRIFSPNSSNPYHLNFNLPKVWFTSFLRDVMRRCILFFPFLFFLLFFSLKDKMPSARLLFICHSVAAAAAEVPIDSGGKNVKNPWHRVKTRRQMCANGERVRRLLLLHFIILLFKHSFLLSIFVLFYVKVVDDHDDDDWRQRQRCRNVHRILVAFRWMTA